MPASGQIRAGSAYVELFVKDNRLTRGLALAEKKLKAFDAGLVSVGTKLVGVGSVLTTPFLLAAKSFADMGSELDDMNQRTGVSIEALSELGFAAKLSGADAETLESGLRKMQKFLVEAATGSKEAASTLDQLGLTFADLKKLNPEEQFLKIADKLGTIENPTLKAALALQLFGKSGTKLLPMLNDGAKGIEELRQKARDLGLTISTEDAKAAADFGDALDILQLVLKRAAFAVGSALAPMLQDFVGWVVRAVKNVTDWVNRNKAFIVIAFKIAVAIIAVGAGLIAIGTAISLAGTALGALGTVISGIGSIMGVVAAAITALLNPVTLIIVALAGLAAYFVVTSETGAQAISWLSDRFGDLLKTATLAWQGIVDAVVAGDLELAAKIAWLTLKMEFQKGVAFLEAHWLDFKNLFIDTFDQAVYGIARLLNDGLAGIESGWIETVGFLADVWTIFVSTLEQGWNRFGGFFAKVWTRIKSLFTEVDVEAEVNRINSEVAGNDNAILAKRDATVGARADERRRRELAIEQGRAGTAKELDQMQATERAGRETRKQDALKQTADELAKAGKEWEDALAEAAKKRAEVEGMRAPDKLKPPDFPELPDLAKAKVDVQGTFNALAVAGLGGESLNERTAKAAEQTAVNTKKLVQEAQMGGIVFA